MKLLISFVVISLVEGFIVQKTSVSCSQQIRTPLHMVGAADEYQNALKQAQKEMMMADMPVRLYRDDWHYKIVIYSALLIRNVWWL
jgi:hypothetical protein